MSQIIILSAGIVCLCLFTSVRSQGSQTTCPCPELHGAIKCPSQTLNRNNYRLHDNEQRGLVGSCLPDTREK